jgi:hypothetical protein
VRWWDGWESPLDGISRDGADFVVGFYPQDTVLNFRDPTVACAEYVVREVKAITTGA